MQKTITVCAVLLSAAAFGACSSHTSRASAAPTTIAPTTTTSTTVDVKDVVPVNGTGTKTVPLPANLSLPEIVHATYSGHGPFVVKSSAADGVHTLASSAGTYEGTFPVGFVDTGGKPTTALEVHGDGPWHLDIASAQLAPHLTAAGVGGLGDAVLYYDGSKGRLRMTHSPNTHLALRTFGSVFQSFARGPENLDSTVDFPAGPLFIAVTADGRWSLAPQQSPQGKP